MRPPSLGLRLTLGSRPSQLARRQTDLVAAALRNAWPDVEIEIRVYTTQGDRDVQRPLPEIGGKGLFTAEIEAALRNGEIDLAVHSLKDLPINDSEGLAIGAVPARAPAHDVLVSRHGLPLASLPAMPRIGTSSRRRAAQLLAVRPDAVIVPLRGNLDTRLRKALNEEYDAIVVAAAGMARLDLDAAITQPLPLDVMLPAPGQGALAVQCRAGDAAALERLRPLHDPATAAAVTAERAFLSGLGGGCSAPVAAYAQPGTVEGSARLWLRGLVASLDGRQLVRVEGWGNQDDPERLGFRLAQEALEIGARQILEGIA